MKPNNLCPCGCGRPVHITVITRKYASGKCRYKVAKQKALDRKIEKERNGA